METKLIKTEESELVVDEGDKDALKDQLKPRKERTTMGENLTEKQKNKLFKKVWNQAFHSVHMNINHHSIALVSVVSLVLLILYLSKRY